MRIIIIIVIIASLSSLAMNVINQMECDSSSNNDGIVMEDRVTEEDGNTAEIVFSKF